MSDKETRLATWYNNPQNPGWDFWGFSNSKEAAEEDAEFAKAMGHQAVVTGPFELPVLPENKG